MRTLLVFSTFIALVLAPFSALGDDFVDFEEGEEVMVVNKNNAVYSGKINEFVVIDGRDYAYITIDGKDKLMTNKEPYTLEQLRKLEKVESVADESSGVEFSVGERVMVRDQLNAQYAAVIKELTDDGLVRLDVVGKPKNIPNHVFYDVASRLKKLEAVPQFTDTLDETVTYHVGETVVIGVSQYGSYKAKILELTAKGLVRLQILDKSVLLRSNQFYEVSRIRKIN